MKKKIDLLIIQRDHELALAIKKLFAQKRIETKILTSFESLLNLITLYKPSVLLLDYELTGRNIFSTIKKTILLEEKTEFIITDKKNDLALAAKFFKAGIRDYIYKDELFFTRVEKTINSIITTVNLNTKVLQYKKQLNENRKKFKLAIEYSNNGVWEFDVVRNKLHLSKHWLELLGYDKSTAPKNYHDMMTLVYPDDVEYVGELRNKLKRGEIKEINCETRLRCRDGEYKWFLVRGRGFFDENGKLIRRIGWNTDITERILHEQQILQLNNSLEKKVKERTLEFRALFKQSPVPVAVYDNSGKIKDYNHRWEKLFYEQLANNNFADLHNLDLLVENGYADKIKKLFANSNLIITKQIFAKTKTDQENGRILILNAYTLNKENYSNSDIVVIIQDITDQIKAREVSTELIKARMYAAATLNVIENERKRIATDLHDAIGQRLFLSKLALEQLKKKSKVHAGQIDETINNLVLINLELKKIIKSLNPIPLRESGLFKTISLLTEELKTTSKINFVFKHSGNENIIDNKSQINIYRIIQEALNNIIRHSFADNAIVNINITDKEIIVQIEDDGKGFFLMENKLYDYSEVHGLINMKERAAVCNGKLGIHSSPENGTKIDIKIPLRR